MRAELAGKPCFLRSALGRSDDGWQLRYLEVVVGERPLGWRAERWEYRDYLFVAEAMTGDALSGGLSDKPGAVLILDGSDVPIPELHQQVSLRRRPSLAPLNDTYTLPWPVCDYELRAQNQYPGQQGNQAGMLIGDDCPSFSSYQAAFRAFFTGNFSSIGSGQTPSDLARVRVVQTDAWLRRIRISPTALDVWVAGEARDGARVEVNGVDWRASKPVGKTGRARFRLPRGLPDDAFLYLNRDRNWLDYRALGARLYGSPDLASQGVEVDIPEDPQAEIEALLSGGEGPYIEYKRQLPDNTTESKRKVLKTIAAFANGEGGHVVFGIDPDELTVYGLGDPLQVIRDRLGNLIRGNIVPPDPSYNFRSATVNGKVAVDVEVQQSPSRPYGLKFHDKPVEFYVRRGASTYTATPEEIRAMVPPPVATTRGFPFN